MESRSGEGPVGLVEETEVKASGWADLRRVKGKLKLRGHSRGHSCLVCSHRLIPDPSREKGVSTLLLGWDWLGKWRKGRRQNHQHNHLDSSTAPHCEQP